MKLSIKEKVAYGLGDTASNFVWQTLAIFLAKFYIDTFGLVETAMAGLFLFARVFDGFIDFGMGAMADRTNSKWGKFRPYILWMAVPLAIMLVLTFIVPGFSPTMKTVYAWVTYNVLMICYSASNIPYSALSGVMTDDPLDRTSLSSYRMVLSQIAGFTINATALPLILYFGHGSYVKNYTPTVEEAAKGYPITMAIYAVVAVILFYICFANTKERLNPPAEQKTRLLDDLARLFKNKYWVMMFFGAALVDMTVIILRDQTFLFYTENFLKYDAGATATLMSTGTFGFMAGAMVTRFVVGAIGKKWGFVLSHTLLALSCYLTYFAAPENTGFVYFLRIFNSFSGGLNAVLFFAMIADTADYSAWKFKVRTTGVVFAATTCAQKIGMGVGGAVSALIMKSVGYIPKVNLPAGAEQSAAAVKGILGMVSWMPALGYTFVAIIFVFYGLNDKKVEEIRGDLMKGDEPANA